MPCLNRRIAGKLTRTAQCEDRFEATIEEQMMPAFRATVARLKASASGSKRMAAAGGWARFR